MANIKVWASAGAVSVLVAYGGSAAWAQGINVTVDGDVVPFGVQKPVEQFGSVLVPLRGVFEKLGATVAYDGGSRSILAVKGATSITLKLGQAQAMVNGVPRALSVPATAVNGTTLVPLRFVSEALGADVKWRPDSRTVVISTMGGSPSAAPVGGSAPIAPPVAAVAKSVDVSSFTHNGNGALRAGSVLTATLEGTPGGTASFFIPGIATAKSVPMNEVSPGRYTGSFTVPGGISVKSAALFATLKRGGASSPVIQSGEPVTVDSVPPQFSNISPAENSALTNERPLIYGTYSDAGTGISAAGTHLLVDNNDVTGDATVTEAFFSYRPTAPLAPGKHTFSAVARDAAGNEARGAWSFTVLQGEKLIRSVSLSPADKTLSAGDVLTVTMNAVPGGKAHFSIGGAVKNIPMAETQAGIYIGTYTVKTGDSLSKAPATVAFVSGGKTVSQAAEQAVTIDAGPPQKPEITSPKANGRAGDSVIVEGRAAPGASVKYTLRFDATLLIVPVGGSVSEGVVKADAQGHWKTAAIPLSAPPGLSRVTYTVEAVTVGTAANETSEATTVQFTR